MSPVRAKYSRSSISSSETLGAMCISLNFLVLILLCPKQCVVRLCRFARGQSVRPFLQKYTSRTGEPPRESFRPRQSYRQGYCLRTVTWAYSQPSRFLRQLHFFISYFDATFLVEHIQISHRRSNKQYSRLMMPRIRLEDSQEMLQHTGEEVGKGVKRMW